MNNGKYPKLVRLQQELDKLQDLVPEAEAEFDLMKDEDDVDKELRAIRLRLQRISESVNQWHAPNLGEYRKGAAALGKSLDDNKNTYSFFELKDLLDNEFVSMDLSDKELSIWRDIQIKKLPNWWAKFRAKPESFLPGSSLEALLELKEIALQQFYGPDFVLDKAKLVYEGNVSNLVYALRHKLVMAISVQAYKPTASRSVEAQANNLQDCGGGLKQWCGTKVEVDQNKVSKQMIAFPKISFICDLDFSRHHKAWLRTNSRLPNLNELIFASIPPYYTYDRKAHATWQDASRTIGSGLILFSELETIIFSERPMFKFRPEIDLSKSNFVVI